MMLAEDDIHIDDNFFEEFASELLGENDEGVVDLSEDSTMLSMPSQKRDFSSFLTPWDPSQSSIMRGAGALYQAMDFGRREADCGNSSSNSPHTTESASECSSSCSDELSKKKTRLEKNRESATKCRLKKKNELSSLTSKITELMKTISRLTQENAALRADNASLSDHNRFLRGLVSSQPELPLYASNCAVSSESQQAAGAASGIAILGIFGAFTMFSRNGFLGGSGENVGRVLENPLQDLMREQSGSQFHVFIVGVFLCILLYAAISYGSQHPPAAVMGLKGQQQKQALLPSHNIISTRKKGEFASLQ